ncbi:MAG: PepSY domain-containing protein [Bacillus sp. (in: firmicutes)]
MLKKLMITGCTLLLLTACGTDQTKENGSTTNQTSTTSEANTTNQTETNNESSAVKDSSNASTPNASTTMDITNPTVSMTEAVNVFKEAHPDAKIESVDLDNDSGRLHYDIDGFDSSKEYETEIDATTKEIKENEVDTERGNDESIDFSAIIDPAKAIEIASTRAEVDGLTSTGWSLEADNGKQKYTIEYDEMNDSDIEIKINAITEEILEVEK